jgi:hypothetical protein
MLQYATTRSTTGIQSRTMLQLFRVERESPRATVSRPRGMMQATAAGNETP